MNSPLPCFPIVEASRLDNRTVKTGFNFRYPSYFRDSNSTLRRDLFKYVGVRFFFVSEGAGQIVSVAAVVLQLSSSMALLTVATLVTDFALQCVSLCRLDVDLLCCLVVCVHIMCLMS